MSLNNFRSFKDIVFDLIEIEKMEFDEERNIFSSELKLVTGLKTDLAFKSGKLKYLDLKKKEKHTELYFEFLLQDFYYFCQNLDKFLLESLAIESEKRFKTHLNEDKLKDVYKPLINAPFKFNQKPLLKLVIPTNTLDEFNLIKNKEYELILKYPRILFYKNKFIIETIIENVLNVLDKEGESQEYSDEFRKQLSILDSDFAN